MTNVRATLLLFVAAAAAVSSVAFSAPDEPHGWTKTGGTKHDGIGGIVLERAADGRLDFLVVHDDKKPDQPRIGRVTVADGQTTYAALAWPAGAEWPVDLESASAIPACDGRFVLLASGGRLFTVDVDGAKVSLVQAVDLPKPKAPAAPNYEAFALQQLDGRLVAVWADRGDKDAPARLFWGPYHGKTGPDAVGAAEIRVPWPEADRVRDVSDLKVGADGVVWATAAWDDDDDDSTYRAAAYVIGVLRDAASPTGFVASDPPVRFRTFPKHKVEAIEIVPGVGIAYGSDDENHGGSLIVE